MSVAETKVGTALNPIELKSNANCLTQEMIEGLVEEEMPLDKAGQITDFEYEGLAYTLPKGYQFVDENGNVINATKIVLEKKKREYLKTFDKCCHVLQTAFVCDVRLHKGKYYDIFRALAKLIVCRDAYWKIAGEEMELDKNWEPDFTNDKELKFCIGVSESKIQRFCCSVAQYILAFPTEEMRDAFYENFKELIEQCKELL